MIQSCIYIRPKKQLHLLLLGWPVKITRTNFTGSTREEHNAGLKFTVSLLFNIFPETKQNVQVNEYIKKIKIKSYLGRRIWRGSRCFPPDEKRVGEAENWRKIGECLDRGKRNGRWKSQRNRSLCIPNAWDHWIAPEEYNASLCWRCNSDMQISHTFLSLLLLLLFLLDLREKENEREEEEKINL